MNIVAIGASAGGLEALEVLFSNLNPHPNTSYIVIQHLSPDYKSMMKELLGRHTDIPIISLEQSIRIRPGNIYLNPPNAYIFLEENNIIVEHNTQKRLLSSPIDRFFISLSQITEDRAIAIILSGTGSDGTLGAKKIKENNGYVIIQDPYDAKFNGMPINAISAGIADLIAPADRIGVHLNSILLKNRSDISIDQISSLQIIPMALSIIKKETGIDFSYYKDTTLLRRIHRRATIKNLSSTDKYIDYLKENSSEATILSKEFLIGVSSFFRDNLAFDILNKKVISQLIKEASIRIWSAGCSTGEEAYSIAILLAESLKSNFDKRDIKIFATDIDNESLKKAIKGEYSFSETSNIDKSILSKYFLPITNGYKVCSKIRDKVIFSNHNIIKDPYFSKLNLISCRNLFIYLKPDIQTAILNRFCHSLYNKGFLFLGSSESIGSKVECFTEIDSSNKIYKIKDSIKLTPIDHLSIINRLDNSTFEKDSEIVSKNDIQMKEINNPPLIKDHINAKKISVDNKEYIVISLDSETTTHHQPSIAINSDEQISILKTQLNSVKDELAQSMMDLESVNHKLQSSNQQLVTANEELQSTNEELQSVNEELYTINYEYQQKINELTIVNNDIENLLKNIDIAAIYLDKDLRIRKITPFTKIITNIMDSDIGRPISHISLMDSFSDISSIISQSIKSKNGIKKEINCHNKEYLLKVRSYTNSNGENDGTIITIINL